MPTVARGEVLGCSNKKLRFWLTFNGTIVAPYSLRFTVYDVSDDVKQLAPSLVWGPQTVNISTPCPAGDYVSSDQGYVASFTMPSLGPSGLYQIRWYWKRTSSDDEKNYRYEFWVT